MNYHELIVKGFTGEPYSMFFHVWPWIGLGAAVVLLLLINRLLLLRYVLVVGHIFISILPVAPRLIGYAQRQRVELSVRP